MNQATIILALLATVTACGHSGQDLFLDQASTALGCGARGEPACANSHTLNHPASEYGDAGARPRGTTPCDDDSECGYGEVCEHRHGPSRCEPMGAAEGHEHSSDDDGTADQGHGDDAADAGTRCEDNDSEATDDRCSGVDHHGGDPAYDDGAADDDRSGSNSGRH